MKTHKLPAVWDANKFAVRYGLNAFRAEFFVDENGLLNYPDTLPDDLIFEIPDSPKEAKSIQIGKVKGFNELVDLLKELYSDGENSGRFVTGRSR